MEDSLEKSFIQDCNNGRLSDVQKIYFENPTIDISARKEQAFRVACYFDHLSVAQWLLSVKPTIDVSAQEDSAFRMACYFGHTSVVQWLVTLKPFLYVIRLDECTGSIKSWHVRVAEHARWQKQKYALWLRSPKFCHSANVFCKIPEDVSRYIVQMFL